MLQILVAMAVVLGVAALYARSRTARLAAARAMARLCRASSAATLDRLSGFVDSLPTKCLGHTG